MTGPDLNQMGQNLSRAASAFETEHEQQVRAAQLDALKAGAAKDYALAAAANSEAARNAQTSNPPVAQSFPVVPPGGYGLSIQQPDGSWSLPGIEQHELIHERQAPPYLASLKSDPGFKLFSVPGVGEVILPNASSMSEAMESLENPVLQAAVLAANVAHFGPGADAKLRKLFNKDVFWPSVGRAVRDKVNQWGARDRGAPPN